MNEHQRIGEAIGELRAFASELRTVPPQCHRAEVAKLNPLARLRWRREIQQMRMLEEVFGALADRIDEIRERMESGNR